MQFIKIEGNTLFVENLFNEQHALELLSTIKYPASLISFTNVGIKIMRVVLKYFQQIDIESVSINYNWNHIMTTPQLVCYDKNQWKTLQQLSNWDREWNQLFNHCYSLKNIELNIHCSWMNDQFCRQILEGIARLPNIGKVQCSFASKIKTVEAILKAFSQAKIFEKFDFKFSEIK